MVVKYLQTGTFGCDSQRISTYKNKDTTFIGHSQICEHFFLYTSLLPTPRALPINGY